MLPYDDVHLIADPLYGYTRITVPQRPGEVAGMDWAEVDGRWWTIPGERAKNGKPHRVFLTDLALSLLPPRQKSGPCFPGRDGQTPMHPNNLVMTLIGIGILCATLVHSLVFPRPVGTMLRRRLAAWLGEADRWALDLLKGIALFTKRPPAGARSAQAAKPDTVSTN